MVRWEGQKSASGLAECRGGPQGRIAPTCRPCASWKSWNGLSRSRLGVTDVASKVRRMERRKLLSGAVLSGVATMASGTQAQQSMSGDSSAGNGPSNTFSGDLSIYTKSGRVSVTSGEEPLSRAEALLHIVNEDAVTCGLRTTSYWTGSAASPYRNNDCYLSEVFNSTESDSLNRSWAGSFCNAYNNIPANVTDSGTRVGIIGWATSVSRDDYIHEGVLTLQVGVHGRAGFQGPGSGSGARVNEAVGVRGQIVTDSAGSSIGNAMAGQFVTRASEGSIDVNMAVYASAREGGANYSFYGDAGQFFNKGKALLGSLHSQMISALSTRIAGNSIEFGHPDGSGYGSVLGATPAHGMPFLAFCAETDANGDTFTTRGRPGSLIYGDLAGGIVFARLPEVKAEKQEPVESVRIDSGGNLCLSANPPPSSNARGRKGEVAWDENFVYICVAANRWKRSALEVW